MTDRLKTADEYHIEPGVGLVIDGQPFPWYVAEEGPMVEALDPDVPLHILWVPIIAEGHAPRAGRPDGEPVTPPAGLTNACAECGDCFHPVVGPNTDGEPCEWCRDCGCHSNMHTRMTRVIPPGRQDEA